MILNLTVAGFFLVASVWGLRGTNAQAARLRRDLARDPDSRIASLARDWRPGPSWLASPARRRRVAAAEADVRTDVEAWHRYLDVRDDLRAWNLLESSVALALSGSLLAIIAVIRGG